MRVTCVDLDDTLYMEIEYLRLLTGSFWSIPFGFGGIARIGEGDLPSDYILGEHVRLGSTSVILSRTFKGMVA